jgi:hypothetical protein
MQKQTESSAFYRANKAHIEKELKMLLVPWISTRLYIYFNDRNPQKRRRTFYANEHRVTYSQCLSQRVDNIVLHKLAGFLSLVKMAEDLRGKYSTAKIYLRTSPDDFGTTLREYDKSGKLVADIDHPFTEDECQVLYYTIENGRLVIHEKQPEQIDFKKEIEENLK